MLMLLLSPPSRLCFGGPFVCLSEILEMERGLKRSELYKCFLVFHKIKPKEIVNFGNNCLP